MKHKLIERITILFFALFLLITSDGFSQAYYTPYPIAASIAVNGTQQRVECTVYDSTLQSTKSYYSSWLNGNYMLMFDTLGKIGYTTWDNFGTQLNECVVITYDYFEHEFKPLFFPNNISVGNPINTVSGSKWAGFVSEIDMGMSYYNLYYFGFVYNMLHHKWSTQYAPTMIENASAGDVWFNSSYNDYDIVGSIDHLDRGQFYYYDPISDSISEILSGCAGWGTHIQDDYFAIDGACLDDFIFCTYDAGIHKMARFDRTGTIGWNEYGIFKATDTWADAPTYFFTYDEAVHQWLTDSTTSTNISTYAMKHRIMAYVCQFTGQPQQVHYIAHNPLTHQLVHDSTTVIGTLTNLQIENGTVKWVDGNGLNIRGYNVNTGWGIYSSPIFMYYQLIDYTPLNYPMIHVRNYSIGLDNVYFDFGDGIVTPAHRGVLFHQYTHPGTYNVCVFDSSSTYSYCQQVVIDNCLFPGVCVANHDTICQGDSIQLSLMAFSGNIQWQSLQNGSWVDETGPGNTDSIYNPHPQVTTMFRAKFDSPGCNPYFSNAVNIMVYQDLSGTDISDTLLSICAGNNFTVTLNPTPNGLFKWQRLNGTNWTNIGLSTLTPIFSDTTSIQKQYRVIMQSGSCFSDTSSVLTVSTEFKPPTPTCPTTNICGPGIATITANSAYPINWYNPSNTDSILFTGNPFSTQVNSTNHFVIEATADTMHSAGFTNNSIGSITADSTLDKGMYFISQRPGKLKSISVYPKQTGYIIFNLYDLSTGFLVDSKPALFNQPNVLSKANLNFKIIGNKPYKLVVHSTTISYDVNTSGISYPIISTDSTLSILGYCDSTLHTTGDYYNFYDWHFTVGCTSSTANALVNVYPPIGPATISAVGPTAFCLGDSIYLQTTNPGLNQLKWLRNGVAIPNANGVLYKAKLPGNYNTVLYNATCSDTSSNLRITTPCIIIPDEIEKNPSSSSAIQMNCWYEPYDLSIHIRIKGAENTGCQLELFDITGKAITTSLATPTENDYEFKVPFSKISTGVYVLHLRAGSTILTKKIQVY